MRRRLIVLLTFASALAVLAPVSSASAFRYTDALRSRLHFSGSKCGEVSQAFVALPKGAYRARATTPRTGRAIEIADGSGQTGVHIRREVFGTLASGKPALFFRASWDGRYVATPGSIRRAATTLTSRRPSRCGSATADA